MEESPDHTRPRLLGTAVGLLLGLVAALGASVLAHAQDGDPTWDVGAACEEATDAPAGCDTEYTPVAKEADEEVWVAEGGALFEEGDGSLVPGSPTPYTVDFFTVRFKTPELGFAGGAACADPHTPFEEVEDCERVPVIYRFLDPDGAAGELPGSWSEHWRGTSRGYVGAIAFLSPAREDAIAVGGTGSYPRRELGRCEAGETTATDDDYCTGDEPATGETDEHYAARDLAGEEENAAGRARVWTHQGGGWTEVSDLPQTPAGDPMRGLTAADCSLGEQAVEENPQVPDTDHTPRAKETELWDQHHGARFPDAERPGSRGPHGAAGDQGAEIETEFDGPN